MTPSHAPHTQVHDLSDRPFVARELMLIKVRCPAATRRELSDLADIFHGSVCDVSLNTITLEIQGKEDKMHALQGLLEPYGEAGLASCMLRSSGGVRCVHVVCARASPHCTAQKMCSGYCVHAVSHSLATV